MDNVIVFALIFVVYLACRGSEALSRLFGQPSVVGAMVFAMFVGSSMASLPAQIATSDIVERSASVIEILGLSGGILFMFLVGIEIRRAVIPRAQLKAGPTIAAGILPFFVCIIVVLLADIALRQGAGFSSIGGTVVTGLALGTTAVPVLVLIIRDLRITGDCADAAVAIAVTGDAVGWIALAVITALTAGGGAPSSAGAIVGVLGVAFVTLIVPALVRRCRFSIGSRAVPLLMLSSAAVGALTTHSLGLHPAIGAVVAGGCFPTTAGESAVVRRMESMTSLLLPMFFIGLAIHAPVQLIFVHDEVTGVAAFLVVAAIAILVKVAAGVTLGWLSGWSLHQGIQLGILLNCRGVAEIAIASVGFHAGLIDGSTFVLLFLFAMFTTCLTAPLLSLTRNRLPVGTLP